MHFQASTSGWLDALLRMPDYSALKGFDAGLLRDGKQRWAAAGRDPAKLTTVLRHAGVETSPRAATWDEAKAHWRAQFWKYIDGTYLREYAPFVDVVSEANEYWADSTWQDPDGGASVKRSLLAAQAVWNDEFRGRTVTNPNDGGHGTISADCRIALGAVTVSFGFPRDLLAAIVAGDNIADMHAYMQCVGGERVPGDWQHCSGLWHFQEQEYGLRPRWLFGESGPFIDTDGGWRREDCLNGDEDKLVAVMTEWWRDLATTPAYREGRLVGAGCWFTSGHVGWKHYQLETPQLVRLADALRPLWKPGVYDMDAELKAKINEQVAIIDAASVRIKGLLTPAWWDKPAPYSFVAQPVAALKLYKNDRVTVDRTLNYTGWEITVRAVDPAGWLKVLDSAGDAGDLWLRVVDVTPK